MSGNDDGFVLTWFDGAFAGWARFTGDNGANGLSSSVYQNLCMFGWTNNNGQVWISTSPFPYVINLNKKGAGLTTPSLLTKPGKSLNR